MARLIPQKQIEEVNIFKDSISVNNSVFISGSLLVSQSIDIGSDLTTPQRVTGSVEITGSLTIDGPLAFANAANRLDATASFADESVDSQRFGGILAKEFGESDATLYVSSTNGSDDNDGRTPQFPLRTIKKAAKIATDGDDGRYGLPTGSLFTGFAIKVDTGTYLEDNPIELPKNTTVWGSGLRVTKVLAKNENEDLFWVNSGNYLSEMTFGNLRVFPSVDVSEKGFAVAFAPNAFITTSPYVQNCSMISNQENSFLEKYEEIPAGGGGLNVDGNRIHPDSPLASMVLDAYTQIAPNGVGCQVVGRGFIQLVSFFTNFSAYSVKVIDGGQAVLLNSNTSFGDYGMYASGSRFITGSGGNADAFFNVQDNYSIIVDTIKNGLSSIPDLVPNTFEGRRITDPNEVPQYFISEDSTIDVAERVKSDFRLVSSIVEDGITNVPKLLAKSGKGGYGPTSLYNVSGDTQYTNVATASSDDIEFIDTNFDITLDIIDRGNVATASYVQIDNVSSSIKVSDIEQYSTFAVQSDTSQRIVDRFDTVISIIENGLTFSPDIDSNASASYKLTETPIYETDVTSSLETIEYVSSSLSIVYDILANGTGSLPTTILSSSVENPSVDIQNAYTLLIENIPFIQDETIAYLSSSWSDHSYNQETCKRDVGFIISSSAHDLLFGGNEESIRSGVYYYQFPSNATTTEKDPTLTGVKYASELAINILGGKVFTEPSVELDNAYDIIYQNKDFVKAETIAYISSSWSEFEYNEASCSRDVGYILDAVATDIHYGGNERSVTAGEFYYKYPSLATVDNRTVGQLQQTLDGVKYAKRITEKLANNDTFVTASASVLNAVNLIKENRSLIQSETITYIDTQYPNFSYDRVKCRRDVGYIIDNVLTDLLYGGNERSELAGLYYFLYPSIANTTQLEETLEAIRYTKEFTKAVAQSIVLETPQVILNVDGNIRVTSFTPTTGSIDATDSEVTIVSQSFGLIEDIIRYGTDSVLSSIAGNSEDYIWNLENPLNVSGITQITSSIVATGETTNVVTSSFDTVIKIIQSGSSITTEETIGTDSKGNPISTVGIPKNSYGDNLVTTTIGTTIPSDITLVKNTEAGILFGDGVQITSSISVDSSNISKVSSSFSIVSDIIKYGISGSLSIVGSSDTSTYFEVVTLEDGSFNINKTQLQKFDDVDGRILGENTGSFDDSVKDPTLTLKRGDLYTFSINSLNNINAIPTETEPFFITTQRSIDSKYRYNSGVTNNGTTFGTITFIVPFDAPDTLFYVNGNDINAGGVINIVDELPLSDTQRYVNVPSLGSFEVITNNVDNIKVTDLSQYSSEVTASISESFDISSSFSNVIDILSNGVGVIPTISKNASGNIKKTSLTQYTSSVDSTDGIINTITSSFNNVMNVIQNGTGSIPTLIENTTDLIKVSSVTQITSSLSGSNTEVVNVSSSFAIVLDILGKGIDSLPIEVSNTNSNIKFYSAEQFTGSLSGSLEDISFVSSSISIVSSIISYGSGSYLTASNYGAISTNPSTIAAYEIIKENIPFIQNETIAYLSSSWSTASYNEASCSRDVGLIVSGAAEDLLYGVYSSSIVNGKFYLEYPSEAETSQLNQTLDGIEYASKLTQNLIQNIEFVTASTEVSASYNLIRNNREFIKEETISYLSSSWSTFDYNEVTCKRDVGHIIDAVSTDLLYGGNERSLNAGVFYYQYPSEATSSQLDQTKDGINYARRLVENIVVGNQFAAAPFSRTNGYDLLFNNKEFIQNEVTEYISSSWSEFEYNDVTCRRDVGYIIDAVATDLLYGGNERSNKAGEFYYLYPSTATTSQLDPTIDGVGYAKNLSIELLQNNVFVTASQQTIEVSNLISENRSLVQNEVIAYISSSWSNFEYNEASCSRDVGYILDAVTTDFYYGGNERSSKAGEFYYLYPSSATVSGSESPNVDAQLYPTVDGVKYAQRLTNKLINNVTLVTASIERQTVHSLMVDNRELIQSEVISFMSSSWSNFQYDDIKCRRDVGYIVDAVATDVLYGGNERSVTAGEFYYLFPSEATTIQSDQTITGITHAAGLADKIIQSTLLVNADSETISAYNSMLDNKELIQNNVTEFIDQLYPYFTYDRVKCRRDVGYIIDAVATDLLWGGNERSIVAGDYYYRYPSKTTSLELTETTMAIEYAKLIVNKLITNVELVVPSISLNTNNNIRFNDTEQYSGSLAISGSSLTDISSSFSVVVDTIQNGLVSLPTEFKNIESLTKVTDATQVTESVSANEQLVSSSYAVVLDILQNGVEVIPTLVENTNGNIKATSTTQITSASAAGATEITKVSSSFALVERIVEGGVDELETIVYNTAGNIKVGNVSQYIGGVGGNSSDVTAISESISIVTDIIQNGTGSLPTIIEYTTPSTDVNTLAAYEILKQNIGFIQSETIAYLSSSWSTASYNEASCSRDVSLIVSGAAEDLIWNSNSASIMNGYYYYLFPSQAQGAQLNQTLDGVFYASRLAQKLIQNVVFESPSTARIAAFDLLRDNTELIQNETIAYLSSSWSGHSYNETTCKRDVGYIIDAVRTDILYGGNERTNKAGEYYYLYPSNATGSELIQTLDGINYAGRLVQKVVQNTTLSNPSTSVVNSYNSILDDKSTIQSKVIAYLSSSFPTHQYNESKCSRDVGYIIDAVATDLFYGGNERSIEAGRFYYLYPSQATGYQIEETVAGIEYAQRLTEVSSKNKGTQIGIVSASIDLINDVIRLGSDNIPFAIAKNFQTSELDTPQNLTTGRYVTASGDYEVGNELAIVSSSFLQINDIIENGIDILPTLVLNTENTIKVTNLTQFTSSLSGTSAEITKVSGSVAIVENIVQNGLSVLPTIVENNTNINNLIKVGSVEQYVSASGADKIQSKIVSSSFGLVIDGLTNGTGSLPTIIEYTERVDAPKTVLAYNLIKENIEFIKEETIQFMSSSWSNFVYNEASCSRDVGLIVSGAAEDLINNSNSASIVNTKFYFEYPSDATGSQLDQTVTAIRYASNLVQNIVRNYEYVTASAEVSSSYNLLVENKEFIVSESIQFVSSSWSDFDYNQNTCGRDVRYIVDAVATDLLYGGNERSVTAGRYYYEYPSSAIVGGVPSATQQKDPTVTAINYVSGLVTKLVGGSVFVTSSNEVEYVYDALRLNREFIQNETIAFVNAKYPNLQYNEASCKRDTGFIVDAVATDLRWGGNQRSLTAGEFYYRFPSQATNVQLGETTDAVTYASDLVKEIVLKNTLSIPTLTENSANNIKVTSATQTLGVGTSDEYTLNAVSSSFGIVMDIVLNGIGSLPTISEYTQSLNDTEVSEAYSLLKSNIPFIQSEVIAYISSSWSGFAYNEASCSRDVGLIVSGAAEDLLFGSVSASVTNGEFYYLYPSDATGSQLNQTLDGIRYASRLANNIIQSVTYVTSSIENVTSYNLLRDNKEFIQSESIAYISSSWSTFGYNEETCKRDVGYIVDAIATDILYGGNERSVTAGDFYYRYPSNATTSELEPTTTGIEYAGDLAEKIIVNEVFVSPSVERIAGNETLLNNRLFIQNEVISYISSSWSNFEYNEASCSRDTGYIVDAVATDLLYGGNERSRTAGEFYYKFPSSATVAGSESPNVNAQLYPTIDGIRYANGISQKLVQNIEFVTSSNEVSSSWNLLRDNKEFIQNEVIAYVSSSWSGVFYNEDKCKRDVGYLIDAAATDMYYGGNERSVTAGSFYYLFPSSATEKGVPSTTAQLDPTVDGIRYAGKLSTKVIKNEPFVQPSASVLVGADLLVGNKELIQKETIAFLSSSWSEFEYNEASCSRDLGYIIDAVRTDLVYGGNERSVQAGTFYYYIPSVATTEQKPQTTDGIDFAKGLSEKVILKEQLVRAPFQTRESVDYLIASKKELQSIAISYTNGAFPGFEYNEEKCYRDTGFIVDAIATDLYYGGNERSIAAAESYYTGVYGSAAEVITNQQYETADVNRYLRTQFQRIVRNSPLEEFGSLIITTGHDFSYAGSGVTYKALPPNQGGAGIPDPDKEITEIAGGRVFFTSGNELGDFRIGTGLVINQATGTLQGRTFSRSLFSLVTPFSLALEG